MKIFGAIMIALGCTFFGMYMACAYLREISFLKNLIRALDYMSCELQYRMTPLPDLCRQAAKESSGYVKSVLIYFSNELDSQICPDVYSCMRTAIGKIPGIPESGKQYLNLMASSMGRFDLTGQIRSIDSVRSECRKQLDKLEEHKEVRVRSFKTLGICAGAGIIILFI